MLLTTLTLGLLMQGPQDMKDWVDQGHDLSRPDAYVVSGTPELTRKKAWSKAQKAAIEDHQTRVRGMAETHASGIAARWLPGFARDKVVAEWTRQRLRRVEPKIVDRDILVREHGFGPSYQAFFLLEDLDSNSLGEKGGLAHRLLREERRFVFKLGGMLGLWGVLALAMTWLDRLTRGYMTKRLYAIGALLALIGPALLVLL